MDPRAMARIIRNRLEYSDALDEAGFVVAADQVRLDVLCVMASDEFRQAAGGNRRFAIRGELDWESMARATATGAGGGAAGGAFAGGIGAVPGAVIGGIGGLVSQPMGAAWYNMKGATAKASSQSYDFSVACDRLAKELTRLGAPNAGAQVQQIGQGINQYMRSVKARQYDQMSQEYGLSGTDAGAWQHAKENFSPANWGKAFNRWRRLMTSSGVGSGMERLATTDQSTVGDIALGVADDHVLRGLKLAPKNIANVGLKGLAKGGVAGMAGGLAVDLAWGKISDAVKGQLGVLTELSRDVGKMAQEMATQMQDPTFIQYGQQVQQIVASVVPQLAQRMQASMPQQQQQGYGYQQAPPMSQMSHVPYYPTASYAPQAVAGPRVMNPAQNQPWTGYRGV